ncbi:hypothetical protein Q5Y75_16010 [Ruegeria sp. 2205SS24-7]|uniref:hypothetical protein n=1 Tax=Ruegeria discodermiae TaxID=3064389 RepID=UPI0027418CD9|nr:hypothetical protein [Ruegeria sp. 2205SS24-7]MDP5218734.1 hypothetical protein [Ruegeria sp. 2205SS24-7]
MTAASATALNYIAGIDFRPASDRVTVLARALTTPDRCKDYRVYLSLDLGDRDTLGFGAASVGAGNTTSFVAFQRRI